MPRLLSVPWRDDTVGERSLSLCRTATAKKWNWLIIVGEWGYLLSKLKNGELYPFRLMIWKWQKVSRADKELREAKTRLLRELEKELLRKDKALAEAAAFLMLREKFNVPPGQQWGRLIHLPERQKIINLVSEVVSSGARKTQACQCIGISVRTLQRWMQGGDIASESTFYRVLN